MTIGQCKVDRQNSFALYGNNSKRACLSNGLASKLPGQAQMQIQGMKPRTVQSGAPQHGPQPGQVGERFNAQAPNDTSLMKPRPGTSCGNPVNKQAMQAGFRSATMGNGLSGTLGKFSQGSRQVLNNRTIEVTNNTAMPVNAMNMKQPAA